MSTLRSDSSAKAASEVPLLALIEANGEIALVLRGEIDAAQMRQVIGRALRLSDSPRPRLALDLGRVTHWDYRCLPDLARLARRLEVQGGELKLCSPSRYLETILRFGGLEGLIQATAARASPPRACRGEAS